MADCNSQGDILAQNDNYIEPVGADFASWSWLNEPMCDESWEFKSTIGGEGERVGPSSVPVVTLTNPSSLSLATSAFTASGKVEDLYNPPVETASYELSGATTDSGSASVSPIAPNQKGEVATRFDWDAGLIGINQGRTNLIVQATNEQEKTGTGTFLLGYPDFHYDEFDDDSIDSKWDRTGTSNAGGTLVEQNDRLEFQMNALSKSSSILWVAQGYINQSPSEAVQGIDGTVGFDQNWDVYHKMALPTLAWLQKQAPGNSILMQSKMGFFGAGSEDIFTQLIWNGSIISIKLGTSGGTSTIINGLTDNNIWFRYKWAVGDAEIAMYYSLTDPTSAGWTGPFYGGKADPQPTGHTEMWFELRCQNNDNSSVLCYSDFVGPWTGG